jgi:hypothetical protein
MELRNRKRLERSIEAPKSAEEPKTPETPKVEPTPEVAIPANTDFDDEAKTPVVETPKEEPVEPKPIRVRKPVEQSELKLSVEKPMAVTSPKEEVDVINDALAIQEDEWLSGVSD